MNINAKTGVYTHNGEEKIFIMYTSLRAYDKFKFVNFVIETLIDDNYHPEIRNMIFDFAIVDVLTDVDVDYIKKSTDAINEIENFLDETNIVDIVKANANDLIDELNKAVDDSIEYRTGIHKNPIVESLSHLLNTIEKKVSGIDTNKMMEMAQALSSISGELTADKMLEAYSKSDMFKERYAQIIADREHHDSQIESIESEINEVKKSRPRKKSVSIK